MTLALCAALLALLAPLLPGCAFTVALVRRIGQADRDTPQPHPLDRRPES
ncbi:hypothetical protein [Streptomyces profundus]|nr:hypothetical protein [Streptomyces sp. MA3_2.13]UED85042.1 hypothetical protein K4G22_13215 [Streptomyces sp. MA3_2.13]